MKKKLILLAVFLIGSLHAFPDFLIIGVTKCGTTSLYDYLIQHPKILGAKKKEIHFFDNHFAQGMKYYFQQFPVKNKADELIGEASPGYFWKKDCLPRIAQHCKKTRLILILRNPTKRSISHYHYFWKARWPHKSFEQAIGNERNHDQIVKAGFYFDHIQRWLHYFPKKQMHIVILEDLIASPEQEVNKIFKFLGLSNYKLSSYEPENKGSYTQGSITPASIQMLEELYKHHNKKLEEFLGRTLPWSTPLTKNAVNLLDDEAFV